MPRRYPPDWEAISLAVKTEAAWRCRQCRMQCLRPGDDTSKLTKSERMARTLTVHHANYTPEDNRPENLMPLCTGCHLGYHNRGQANISLGQLSLFG